MSEVSADSGDHGGKKSGKPKSKKSSTHIDMTPMVDLAFLLLTFFMLTTSFSRPNTMEVTMPHKPKPEDKIPEVNKAHVFNVLLAPNDKIMWYIGDQMDKNITDYSADGIRKLLLDRIKKDTMNIVLIKAYDKSKYKNLVDIFDEMTITNQKRYVLGEIGPAEKKLIEENIR